MGFSKAPLTERTPRPTGATSSTPDHAQKHVVAGPAQASRTLIGNITTEQQLDRSHVARVARVLTAIGPRHAMQQSQANSPKPRAASHQARPKTLPALTAREHAAFATQTDAAPTALAAELREKVAIDHPDKVRELLYLPDEPRLGASAPGPASEEDNHALSVMRLHSSTTHVVYAVTTPEHRIRSSAKRRRWAMACSPGASAETKRPLLACMEFRRPDELELGGGQAITQAQHLEQIQRELRALSAINPDMHIHGLLETQDNFYLALMTNLPEEASYLLESTPDALFDATLVHVLGQAIARLDADVHQKDLVHGDIKLNNIMLTPQGAATLIDVASLAQVAEDGFADILSTSFAPPEQTAPQAQGARLRFGKAGDIFSVGLALLDACSEREATLLDTAALNSPHAARLMAHADELRANKAWLMHEMTAPNSPFYAWRKKMLASGLGLKAVLNDTSRYGRACHYMARRFPEIFEHWLTSLSSDDPAQRSSLAPTLELLDKLAASEPYQASAAQVQQNIQNVIGQSMSAQLEPLLNELLDQEDVAS